MKKSASNSEKPNKIAANLTVKNIDPRLKPLAINFIVAIAVAFGSYAITGHVIEQQQNQALTEFGQNAAIIIDSQISNWEDESNLLAQLPSLKAKSHVKAIIGVDGVIPADLGFADQDLLNRTHKAPTGAEITNIGSHAIVTTAVAMPAGGYLVSERPFSTLSDDLKKMTPANIQLTLSQTFVGGQPLVALTLNSDATNSLTNVPLKAVGWQLNIGKVVTSSLNPMTNIPLLAGLLAFIASLLSMVIWFLIKPQRVFVAPTQLSADDRMAQLDAIALELTPTQSQTNPPTSTKPNAPELRSPEPILVPEPVQTMIKPEPINEVAVEETASIISPEAKPDFDDLSYLDDALDTP